jgi:hypothetical protein
MIVFYEEQKSSFPQLPVTSSLLPPRAFFNTLFSDILSLWPPLIVRDQVSHPYNTKLKIVDLRVLIFTFLDNENEDSYWHKWQHACP